MRLPLTRLTITLGILGVVALWTTSSALAQPVSLGTMGTAAPVAEEEIKEVSEAKTRFTSLDFAGALEKLREAVEKNPDRLPPAQVIMALWYAQIEQANAVMASLETAILEAPDDPEAYLILAETELQGGRVTSASLLYDKVQTLMQSFTESPKRKEQLEPRLFAGLAAISEARASLIANDEEKAKAEWATAENYLRRWLALDSDNAAALQRLARALFKQKTTEKVNEALERLQEAEKADPGVLNPYAQMAMFYQEEGDFDNAKKFMDYALDNKPKDLRTLLTAARWCLLTSVTHPGQLAEAAKHADAANTVDPQSLEAIIFRGVISLFQKEYEIAERYFVTAHLQSPGNFAASNNLALARCEQEDDAKKRQALELAVNNVKQFNDSVEAASTYGWVLFKNGRTADADQVLGRLVRSARVPEDTLYYAARVASAVSTPRPNEALQLVERAVKSEQPFTMRPEAEAFLEQLKRNAGQ